MNENVKAICLQIAELALETEDIFFDIRNSGVTIHHLSYDYENESLYYDCIKFSDGKNAEEQLQKALDYIRSLGGNYGV